MVISPVRIPSVFISWLSARRENFPFFKKIGVLLNNVVLVSAVSHLGQLRAFSRVPCVIAGSHQLSILYMCAVLSHFSHV